MRILKQDFIWLVYSNLLIFFGGSLYVFLNFAIFSSSDSLSKTIIFNLVTLLIILFSTGLAGFISNKWGVKVTLFLATAFNSLSALIAFLLFDSLSDLFFLVSVLSGLSVGFQKNSYSLFDQLVTTKSTRVRFSSYVRIFDSVLSVLSPIFITLMVTNFDYKKSLLLMWLVLFYMSFGALVFKLKEQKQEFAYLSIIKKVRSSSKLKHVAQLSFAMGVTFSVNWGIMDVLIVAKLGSLEDWRTVRVGLAILTIGWALILRRFKFKDFSKIRAIIASTAFFYAIFPIILITSFTNTTFIIFNIVQTLFLVTNSVLLMNYLIEVLDDDPDFNKKIVSYQMFRDSFMGIGRVSPVAVMFLISFYTFSVQIAVVLIVLTTSAPFLAIGALKQNENEDDLAKNPFLEN